MDLVVQPYLRFNAQDIDGIFELLQPDVIWANGMEGGIVTGYDEVRSYWTRQWKLLKSKITPLNWTVGNDVIEVNVRQQIFSLSGDELSDDKVLHRFECSNGKIARFEIVET